MGKSISGREKSKCKGQECVWHEFTEETWETEAVNEEEGRKRRAERNHRTAHGSLQKRHWLLFLRLGASLEDLSGRGPLI